MKKINVDLLWGDSWHIEENEAWFVPGDCNELFHADLMANEMELLATLPKSQIYHARTNQNCLKCGNDIYCMPDRGESIWVYRLDKAEFYEIEIRNNRGVRLGIYDFWHYDKKIYAVSIGLKQLIEISSKDRKIQGYYNLCQNSDEQIAGSILVGTKIYSVSAVSSNIYQFDIKTKERREFIVPGIKSGLQTICYDGQEFWLSGFRKEIYVWNIEQNTVRILDNFPQEFGGYDVDESGNVSFDFESVIYNYPAFTHSLMIGQAVWFIPYMSTEILYADKITGELNVFKIEQETETKESLAEPSRRMPQKYYLEYVREERYIGLYSLKNKSYFEIDAFEKSVSYKSYSLSENSLRTIAKLYIPQNGVYYQENNVLDRDVFWLCIEADNCEAITNPCLRHENVGAKIYQSIV